MDIIYTETCQYEIQKQKVDFEKPDCGLLRFILKATLFMVLNELLCLSGIL
jgi:hypothetical protein